VAVQLYGVDIQASPLQVDLTSQPRVGQLFFFFRLVYVRNPLLLEIWIR
jgi:hypothetical protein